jgi:hypothetical protein
MPRGSSAGSRLARAGRPASARMVCPAASGVGVPVMIWPGVTATAVPITPASESLRISGTEWVGESFTGTIRASRMFAPTVSVL